MKLAAGTFLVYSFLILGSGIYSYFVRGSVASAVAGLISGTILFLAARYSLKGVMAWGYCGGGVTFLLAIYFAYRFILSERFVPAGVLLMLSFLALFLILLGVFLGLQQKLSNS